MSGKSEILKVVGEKTRFTADRQPENRGRKPGVPSTAARLRRFLEVLQKTENPVTKELEELTVAEQMDLQQLSKALKGDTAAWEKILDRLEGKAKQKTEHSGPDGGAIEVARTVVQIKYRAPQDREPTESKTPQPAKGERRKG